MKIQYLLFVLILLASCGESEKQKAPETETIELVEVIETVEEPKTEAIVDSSIFKHEIQHYFSETDSKDRFSLSVYGKKMIDGNVVFKIENEEGRELYSESFPTYLLMDYGFEGNHDSEKEREKYMKKRIKEYFNEDNFSKPAIGIDEVFDSEYSKQEVWEELKKDKTAVGFHYYLGAEDGRSIAFLKKKRKVKIYHTCC